LIGRRCDALAGLTVHQALQTFKYRRADGKMWCYNKSDLRYDIKGGRLVVEAVGAKPLRRL
jgi:hypothetical protein